MDTSDGVVRCGACEEAFQLPDFVAELSASPELDTAIIDTRSSQDAAGFERRDTEVVPAIQTEVDTSQTEDTTETYKSATVVNEPEEGGDGPWERSTVVDIPVSRDFSSSVQDVVTVPGHRLTASETPTLVVHGQEEVRRGQGDTMQLRTPDAEADTLPVGDVPPAAALVEESPKVGASTASTQPTTAPPEFLAVDHPLQSDPMTTTQRAVQTRSVFFSVVSLGAFAMLMGGIVLGAFYYAEIGTSTRTETDFLQWSLNQAVGRSEALATSIERVMLAGRPDLARSVVSGFPGGGRAYVVRPDGTRAYANGDLATYKRVLGSVCTPPDSSETTPSRGESAWRLSERWLAGDDLRLTLGGGEPCEVGLNFVSAPPVSSPADRELVERVSSLRGDESVSWIDTTPEGRRQVVVRPIPRGIQCVGCHRESNAVLGYVVVHTDLSVLDAVLTTNRGTLFVTSCVAAGFICLLLLLGIRLVRRGVD